ncbi:fumarylacetoacetate hydrolase family protein [Dyella nitratireducens]|uniref:2-hydroxyhepta-2,4-diene-1,7-dioate isomerase n=1 Tax=Dyella nitratireducens TaxID=1849580 RepID=A0ABQ1GFT3_9GAMM|nr:fumarylacetoacetate hydrolase family protein [Dyella nitratireducens]GGA42971.1 2-hydroxyhepta-2,4-diene-1,7-dioate isomerase [Dyella nitratireducens]GLQ41934.1 2-hydroxyhepta-2,4-diene-1,7-dioate isomerase [Dyella nitratireducens]
MKLVRYGTAGKEKPGLIDKDGALRDLSAVVTDIDAQVLGREGRARLAAIDPQSLPLVAGEQRYGAPVSHVSKFICVGLNYSEHAAETGAPIPEQPILFMKATSALNGPNDDVIIPHRSVKTDWEVELGVVIGETARSVSVENALAHVAGYVVVNDLSEREFQLEHGGQWVKGKSCDTFGPIGPWLVTTDDVPDPQNLDLWLEVNGHRYQNGNTRTMIFGVAQLVSYISRYMTLLPGDVISTGTPSGVGLGLKPPVYLRPGDVIELGIDGLGTQRQRVHAHPNDR